MKKMFKKLFVLTVVVCTTIVCAFSSSCGKTTKDKIVIGLSGPLTGAAAIYGISVQNAAQMAVDEINLAGGISGYQVELVVTDDKHDASLIQANYATLVEKGMQVSLGCVTTKPCLEFAKVSEADNLFFITPSATSDAVVEYENAYQMCFSDLSQGTYSAQYVNANIDKSTKIGVLYRSGDDYSEGIYKNFMSALDSDYEVAVASFADDKPTDLSSQVNLLKDCEFIFMPIYYTPASVFMTQAKGYVSDDAIYFGADGLDGIDSIEGFDINTIPQEISMLSHFNSNATTGVAKEFIDKYVEKYGKETLSQFGASAYDCVYALKEAIEKDGTITPNTSASDVCEKLKAVFQGGFTMTNRVTGTTITWDKDGFVDKDAVKYTVKAANK